MGATPTVLCFNYIPELSCLSRSGRENLKHTATSEELWELISCALRCLFPVVQSFTKCCYMTPKGWRYREHPHGYRLSVRSDYTTTSIWLDYKTTLLHDSHIPTISRLYLGDCKGCFLWGGDQKPRVSWHGCTGQICFITRTWSTLTPVHTWICLENQVYCLIRPTRPSLSIGLLVS